MRDRGRLKWRLPVAALKSAGHSFDILTYTGGHPRLRSRVVLTCAQDLTPLLILAAHEADLGRYWITQAEVASDASACTIDAARRSLFELVGALGKRHHQRGHVRSEHKPDQARLPGHVPEPTFYLEDRKGSVGLKCYARHAKLLGGQFGGLCVRLEWTLSGQRALTRHLGGNQIDNLLKADLNAFLARNVRLEQVDRVALGNLFRGIKITARRDRKSPQEHRSVREQWTDPDYRAERAAFLVLRLLACREHQAGRSASWDQALWTCQNSPAQIRGYCRELRDGKRSRRGRPRKRPPRSRLPVTDHRISALRHHDRPGQPVISFLALSCPWVRDRVDVLAWCL